MNLLLDTHIFLWFVSGDPKLQPELRDAIMDLRNGAYLSVASVWEAEIKYALGKLTLPGPAAIYLSQQRMVHRIKTLPVDEAAVSHLSSLPPLHRDPFDRMLVAQAIQHRLTLVTVDSAIRAYAVPSLPA